MPSFGSIAGKVTANLLGAGSNNKMKEMGEGPQNFDLQSNDTDLIDLDTNPIQYTASFKTSEDTEAPSLTKTESTGPSKTSFTTANGDGLTFDPFSLNIFDEI